VNDERFFSVVDEAPPPQKTAHFVGAPSEVSGTTGERELLRRARIVVLERRPDGVFLYRYASDGTFAGDTWHMTFNEAKEQAVFEYGDAVGKWRPIPPDAGDAAAYALSQVDAP